MTECHACNRCFPERLLNELESGDAAGNVRFEMLCPICALARINELSGVARVNFSPGSRAQAMLEEARRIVAG